MSADLRQAGVSIRRIAARLGRAPSTISRELRRNATGSGYRPFEAHRQATARRARDHKRRIETTQRWSPQQISRHLKLRFVDDPSMWLSTESIYQAVYMAGSPLRRALQARSTASFIAAHGTGSPSGTTATRSASAQVRQPMLTIHQCPFPLLDRSEAGHREGDLIIGRNQGSAIGTLVERQTRILRLVHLPARDSETLHDALAARMQDLPPRLLRSITWDQGTEMARHTAIAATLGTKIYFCDSRSPWQRPSNENTNGLLRQYFPKGTDLSVHPPDHLIAVEDELNCRPRMVLEDRPPIELFRALLASSPPPALRR